MRENSDPLSNGGVADIGVGNTAWVSFSSLVFPVGQELCAGPERGHCIPVDEKHFEECPLPGFGG